MKAEPGVHHVTCWSDGRPDLFVVVVPDQAHPRWLALADVIVHPGEPTVSAASRVAADTLCRSPGCALVAVGVWHVGSLVRSRCGRERLCPGDGSVRDTVDTVLVVYRLLTRA